MARHYEGNLSVLKFIALAHDFAECNETLGMLASKQSITNLLDPIGNNMTCCNFVNSMTSSCDKIKLTQKYVFPSVHIVTPNSCVGSITSCIDRLENDDITDVEYTLASRYESVAKEFFCLMILSTLPTFSPRMSNQRSTRNPSVFSSSSRSSNNQVLSEEKSTCVLLQNELDFIDSYPKKKN